MTHSGVSTAGSVVSALRATYGAKAALDRNDALVSRFVYRPLSFYLSVPFVRLGLSPNQVSFVGFGVSLVGMALLASGDRRAAVWGSALCAFQVLLDYVDGNIARLRASTSHLGKFVDGLVDTVIGTLLPVAVGVGLMKQPDGVLLALWPAAPGQAAILLGTVIAIATSLRSVFVFRLRAARYEAGGQDGAHLARDRGEAPRRSAIQRLALWFEVALRNEMFTMLSAIVLFAWTQTLGAFLLIRALSSALTLAIEALRTWAVARRDLEVYRSH